MRIEIRLVFLLSCVCYVSGSAIPMWEYLNKDEKMAYLYNTFANQVEEVCSGPKAEECTKDLLKYGLKNLHGMPEDHLDAMDPYQRDANSLIWKSFMDGHSMMSQKQFTTSEPDVYALFSESNYLGSASSQQETILNPDGKLITLPPGGKKQQPASSTTRPQAAPATDKHFGPMVVKVHLDGRPVQEEKQIPSDDDLHHHHIVKTKVPQLDEVASNNNMYSPYPYAVYVSSGAR